MGEPLFIAPPMAGVNYALPKHRRPDQYSAFTLNMFPRDGALVCRRPMLNMHAYTSSANVWGPYYATLHSWVGVADSDLLGHRVEDDGT